MNKQQSTKSNTIPIPAHLQQIITETSFACKNDWQIRTMAIRYIVSYLGVYFDNLHFK